MKCSDFASFKKQLNPVPPICLFVAKDETLKKKAVAEVLKESEKDPLTFNSENFSLSLFLQELDTLPFLKSQKIVLLENIEELELECHEALSLYCQKPNSWICLILTASHLSATSKLMKVCEKKGLVLCQAEEKPWEKEKRLQEWTIDELKKEGIEIDPQAVSWLVQSGEGFQLKQEIEKIICFIGKRRKINLQDLQSICHFEVKDNAWLLGDAIFQNNGKQALLIYKHLIENENEVFSLLASLRSQMETAYRALLADKVGGKEAVTKAFPYLKGAFLEKKLKLFHEYGLERLKKGLLLLFEAEIRLKNTSYEQKLIFELTLSRLTDDTLSSSECFGAYP